MTRTTAEPPVFPLKDAVAAFLHHGEYRIRGKASAAYSLIEVIDKVFIPAADSDANASDREIVRNMKHDVETMRRIVLSDNPISSLLGDPVNANDLKVFENFEKGLAVMEKIAAKQDGKDRSDIATLVRHLKDDYQPVAQFFPPQPKKSQEEADRQTWVAQELLCNLQRQLGASAPVEVTISSQSSAHVAFHLLYNPGKAAENKPALERAWLMLKTAAGAQHGGYMEIAPGDEIHTSLGGISLERLERALQKMQAQDETRGRL